jgi:hypothetical protein
MTEMNEERLGDLLTRRLGEWLKKKRGNGETENAGAALCGCPTEKYRNKRIDIEIWGGFRIYYFRPQTRYCTNLTPKG